MKKHRLILTIPVLIFFITASHGEVLVSIDTGVDIALNDEVIFTPGLGFSGSFDIYKPVNKFWSLFFYGIGNVNYQPKEDFWLFNLELEGDICFRKNKNLIRFSLNSEYDGFSGDPFGYMGLSPQLFYSKDFGNFTLFTTHSITKDFSDLNYFAYDGDLGLSLLTSPFFIIDPQIAGGVTYDGIKNVFYQDTAIEYSWYPGIPYVLDGKLGFKIVFETIYVYEFYIQNELTISLGNPAQLMLRFPASILFNDDLSDISLLLQPEIAIDFSFGKKGILILSSGGVIENDFISNENDSSLFFSLKMILSLR